MGGKPHREKPVGQGKGRGGVPGLCKPGLGHPDSLFMAQVILPKGFQGPPEAEMLRLPQSSHQKAGTRILLRASAATWAAPGRKRGSSGRFITRRAPTLPGSRGLPPAGRLTLLPNTTVPLREEEALPAPPVSSVGSEETACTQQTPPSPTPAPVYNAKEALAEEGKRDVGGAPLGTPRKAPKCKSPLIPQSCLLQNPLAALGKGRDPTRPRQSPLPPSLVGP